MPFYFMHPDSSNYTVRAFVFDAIQNDFESKRQLDQEKS